MADLTARKPTIAILVPCALSRSDADDLRWYCHLGGSAVFVRSNMSQQIAHLERSSRVSVPCERCGGSVELDRIGCGFIPAHPARHARHVAAERAAWLAQGVTPPDDVALPPEDAAACPDCQGFGFKDAPLPRVPAALPPSDLDLESAWEQRRITAWPTGSSRAVGYSDTSRVGEVDLARMGVVARRLALVAEAEPRAVLVLDAYYGEDGDQLLPLYEMTPAGRKLLRRSRNELDLTATQRLENEIATEAQRPDPNRRALLDTALSQAGELLQNACQVWNRLVYAAEYGPSALDWRGQVREALEATA